ncbi:hypothetical protein [Acholeplasma granularum]|uniref:hypothetical protein n=1 Tax=Acholeplasma granularum TaxID=264635 RepID=UPI00046FECCB|nr:hypothetical protein [Acholeplasma granularum]
MEKILDLKHISIEKQHCFGGAWYYKVMSKPYDFNGIEGVITLPMPLINRFKDNIEPNLPIDFNHKNLDVSSIYMGGHAKYESDVGLALSRANLDGNVTEGSCVYRPFWRYITDGFDDAGTYDLKNNRNYSASILNNKDGIKNVYAHYHPSFSEFYYLPGDKLLMRLTSPKPNYLVLEIKVLEVSKLEYSINFRKKYNLKQPQDFKSPQMSSPGHGVKGIKTYKRVNAIDQVSNEGKEAILTKTVIKDAIWNSCHLLYKEDGKQYKTPFNEDISVQMACPLENAFITTAIDEKTGGQKITISPIRG